MVGGHVANLLIEDKTILVSPIRQYYEKEIPILHGYFMMRMMIDHQVQHLMDSYDAINTETPIRSDYFKPRIGVDCIQHTPLQGFNFADDLMNYTLITHAPASFDNKSEVRAFMASVQVAYQYKLFTSDEITEAICKSKLNATTENILKMAVIDAM